MRCRNCGDKFTPKKFLMKYCDKDECQSVMVRETLSKVKKFATKEKNKATKVMKDSLLSKRDYLKMLQIVFNSYIRLRDKDDPCISCGTTANVKYDAGHYYHSNYSFLRFNEDNVHKQCSKHCNVMLSGNLIEYGKYLEKKIGFERLQWLHQHRHDKLDLSIEQIKELIKIYRNKLKQLK